METLESMIKLDKEKLAAPVNTVEVGFYSFSPTHVGDIMRKTIFIHFHHHNQCGLICIFKEPKPILNM